MATAIKERTEAEEMKARLDRMREGKVVFVKVLREKHHREHQVRDHRTHNSNRGLYMCIQ